MSHLPSSLLRHLRECSPDFAAEPAAVQVLIATMLQEAIDPRRRHTRWPDAAYFSKAAVRRIWGDDARMRRTFAGKHFHVRKGNHRDGYAGAYQPSEELLEGLLRCAANPEVGDLIEESGAVIREFGRAIAPTLRGSTTRAKAWHGIAPANAVEVNMDNLDAVASIGAGQDRRMAQLLLLYARNTLRPGSVPARYVQSRTGRLTGTHPSLQAARRVLRAAALEGCWDYDIECCHHAILAALGKRLAAPTPNLDSYVKDRAAVRAQIATECGLSVEAVKAAMVSVVYGAPVSQSPEASMARNVGEKEMRRLYLDSQMDTMPDDAIQRWGESTVEALQLNRVFMALVKEVKRLRAPIIDAHRMRAGHIRNAMGTYAATGASPASKLAHILQGYEAAALRAVVRMLGERVLVCMHDGWITREPIDRGACEAAMLEDTEIPMRIEENQLQFDLNTLRQYAAPAPVDDWFPQQNQPLAGDAAMGAANIGSLRGVPVALIHASPGISPDPDRCEWNFARR